MGIIEETAVKAKDAFDVVAKKTGEVWSLQKLKFNIASENSQISKDFETLGRLYYESLGDENSDITEEVEKIKQSIAEKEAKIKEYEAAIDEQKKTNVCECGAKNPADSVYCSKCGKKLK